MAFAIWKDLPWTRKRKMKLASSYGMYFVNRKGLMMQWRISPNQYLARLAWTNVISLREGRLDHASIYIGFVVG